MKRECLKYQSMVESFLEGKLSGYDRQSFVDHVKDCKTCHEELEIYHVIFSVINELNDESGRETSNYMETLEKKLGSNGNDKGDTRYDAAYGFLIAGISAIIAGVALLIFG
ncbi:MAG: hypothetical protein K5795_01320 [Lachnospiraceae bacterium]|nr:hypothetical protein [Lachnospiraceae bacterium]